MTAIHVSIPVRLLEDFDETLRFNQSRSAKISTLIENHLDGGRSLVHESTSRQLMHVLAARDDVDETMKHLLLQILAKTP
jgi:metal-responsive CopG/Arc/MetJ family transcriptional regulator